MDQVTYQKLQQEICAGCASCRRKLAALDVVFDKADKTESNASPAPAPAAKETIVGSASNTCALCPNRVRRHYSGCPGCGRKICPDHRTTQGGLCIECAPGLRDRSAGNGEAHAKSEPKLVASKKRTAYMRGATGRIDDFKPAAGLKCESCGEGVAAVKCAVCSKFICGREAREQNGQCSACVKVLA